MKILITGAAGLVGSATAHYCRELGDEVIAKRREDLDISNKEAVVELLKEEKPDSVINCAAWTDVDGCETNAEKNYAANAYGVENLAAGCRLSGANLVTISTDYVFDGAKDGFYTQRDDPNPLSVYGQAKLKGERLAQEKLARTIIVRSGWIFGAGGRNFLSKIPEILLNGGNVKAISDAWGTPTFAPDLARRLRELAEADLPGIYHVTNFGEGATYEMFARSIGETKPEQIESVLSSSLKRPAPRPLSSKLSCLISEKLGFKPLQHWEKALKIYVESIEKGRSNV